MSGCMLAVIIAAALAIPALVVFGALGFYGFKKYIANAKTAEAKNSIGQIARSAVAAYEADTGGKHRFCGSATPAPRSIPKATRVTPSADEWSGTPDAGWTCLRFSITTPVYYQYSYVTGPGTGKTGVSASGVEASARGDLDGNGITSLFARGVDLKNGVPTLSTSLYVENEFE